MKPILVNYHTLDNLNNIFKERHNMRLLNEKKTTSNFINIMMVIIITLGIYLLYKRYINKQNNIRIKEKNIQQNNILYQKSIKNNYLNNHNNFSSINKDLLIRPQNVNLNNQSNLNNYSNNQPNFYLNKNDNQLNFRSNINDQPYYNNQINNHQININKIPQESTGINRNNRSDFMSYQPLEYLPNNNNFNYQSNFNNPINRPNFDLNKNDDNQLNFKNHINQPSYNYLSNNNQIYNINKIPQESMLINRNNRLDFMLYQPLEYLPQKSNDDYFSDHNLIKAYNDI